MSIGSLGVIGSVASGQLQQTRSAGSDQAAQNSQIQAREKDATRQAEAAEGVGELSQDEGTSDRDADGRRLWERPAQRPKDDTDNEGTHDESRPSADPTGVAGGNLDLTG